MALAGTRNAKALAWNSGSLEREAQSSRDRVGGGEAGTQRQGTWGGRGTERGTGRITHRDRDTEEQGQGQNRGKSLRPQAGL